MPKHEFVVLVRKMSERKLNQKKLIAQVYTIASKAVSGDRERRGWTSEVKDYDTRFAAKTIYEFQIVLRYNGEQAKESLENEVHNILLPLIERAGSAITPPWIILALDGKAWEKKETMAADGKITKPYAHVEIPKDWRRYFSHLYDRDPQIDVTLSYVQAAIDSNWLFRPHMAYVGEPGGGKTETVRALKSMLGGDAVMELDATATTMAGVVKNMKERTVMPRILVLEEIEKAKFEEWPWLLAVMDKRGEMRKLTYREDTVLDTQMLVIGLINNYRTFHHALEGALCNRFGEPIFFPKADRKTQHRILVRDVKAMDGDVAWVDPALDYAREMGIYEIRHILSICLAGKGRLLEKDDKSFQTSLKKTRIPEYYLDKLGMMREKVEEDQPVAISGSEKQEPAKKRVPAKV